MNTGVKKTGVLFLIMLTVTLAGVLVTLGLNRGNNRTEEEQKFRIVTSFYPMYIATWNLVDGLEGVSVSNLTENQGGCLHDYQLTAADMKKLETASVLIINGGGMETFLGRIKTAYPELAIIDASEGIETKEGNAHYWVDPERYKKQLVNITAGLGKLDEGRKENYEENRRAYEKKVDETGEKMLAAVKNFPKEKAVLFHDAFYYLAEYLGIETVYSIEMEEDTSLNTGEIAEIVDKIREEKVKLLFTEKQFSTDTPLSISKETKALVCVVDTLVSGEFEKDAYFTGMEKNLQAITECMKMLESENGERQAGEGKEKNAGK